MISWMIHQVCDGHRFTYHTHGLDQYNSLELELNLMLVPDQATLFINLVGESIADGKRYHSGQRVDDIFSAPFYLLETSPVHESCENDRVLRIVFCDPQFKFPWDQGFVEGYRDQLNSIEILEIKQLLALAEQRIGGFSHEKLERTCHMGNVRHSFCSSRNTAASNGNCTG